VYNLARRLGIHGFVLNSSAGLIIEAEGDECAVDEFLKSLRNEAPPLARIEEVISSELEALGNEEFEIRESQPAESEFVLVSRDVATCDACLSDVTDPLNRRYAYPFTNCTNCGPRYTIIRDIPYDRPMTTMAGFRMCAECEAEYHDPADRRFHAQPNACPKCGPGLALVKSGSSLPVRSDANSVFIMQQVRELLHQGAIVAIKGLGGFQLACDARNNEAVRQLRRRKKRSDKPFAVMARDVAAAERVCLISSAERELLLSPEHPIVVLHRRPGADIAPEVAPGNETLGVMLAYTPLHLLLFGGDPGAAPEFDALVMTSGNISEEPIVTSNEEAQCRLAGVADWFLLHNRDIWMRVDDSVARVFDGQPLIVRRSRGYAPLPIDLGSNTCELLACGAELKNTFCLTKGHYAILSQHMGDLENYETLEFYRETLANLKKLFRVEPQAVAHDLHPLYLSTRLASELPLPTIAVQHHHAHIASCMAENHLRGKVIGVAFDGTGYGTDGQIWGGEFLVADLRTFERRAHFRYVSLPGGDTAVRQIWRPALAWLREAFGAEIPLDLPLFREVPGRELSLVSQMLARGVNTVRTSSCGRLFDAVASLIGLRQQATFEGQAAIELETAIQPGIEDRYSFEMEAGEPELVDFRPAIREIVRDVCNGVSNGMIAAKFHNTIAAVILEVCCRIRAGEGLDRVCLSGGTFQNVYLLTRTVRLLRSADFEVFTHSAVPPNDGGIALGQAVIASEILRCGA
jgi:hydrogenase maturation protein HypF